MHLGAATPRQRLAYEGRLLGLQRLQLLHHLLGRRLGEARADPADIDETPTAMDADLQRAQTSGFTLEPAADDDLMPGAAFDLVPAVVASRLIGGIQVFGDDPFERHAPGGFEDGGTVRLEMLDIAQELALVLAQRLEQRMKPRLALAERQVAQILVTFEQKVEGEEDQVLRLPLRERGLEGGEIRRAVIVQRRDLTVDDRIGQAGGRLLDGREFVGPIQPRTSL